MMTSNVAKPYSDLIKLAAKTCGTSFSFLLLLDENRLTSASSYGEVQAIEQSIVNLFQKALDNKKLFQQASGSKSEIYMATSNEINPLGVSFLAGTLLSDENNGFLGVLCVGDALARVITEDMRFALKTLSEYISNAICQRNSFSKKATQNLHSDPKISLLPEKNPNPVLCLDLSFNILYKNNSSNILVRECFDDNGSCINELLINSLQEFILSETINYQFSFKIDNSEYIIWANKESGRSYLIIYASDVTLYAEETRRLKYFYETILDYFPVDIGVFDTSHRYLYVNKQGIKNEELRKFMIGKTDFDYCDYRKLPYDLATVRRNRFNQAIESREIVHWIDQYNLPSGKKQYLQRQFAPIFNDQGSLEFLVGYGVDFSELKEIQNKISDQLELMGLISEIASSFVGIDSPNLHETIRKSLQKISAYLSADRCYFYTYNWGKKTMELHSFWAPTGDYAGARNFKTINFKQLPESYILSHVKGNPVFIPDISVNNDYHFFSELAKAQVTTIHSYPCMDKDSCIGFFGVDYTTPKTNISDSEALLLQLFSQILSSSYVITKTYREIQVKNDIISEMNLNLEKTILEKTSQNQELTQMLANLDKMAMIGELTANITHDLNTPIGSIKASSESIQHILDNNFVGALIKCSPEQINWAFNRKLVDVNIVVGGKKSALEKKEWIDLMKNYPIPATELPKLIDGFIKARVLPTNEEELTYVINHQNRLDLLELMYSIMIINSFNLSIHNSADRASEVIKNLRFYIKEGKKEALEKISLAENITTVLRVFQNDLNKGIQVQMNVHEEIELYGYRSKLYQLWSNIIKNAVDALGSRGNIFIQIYREDGGIWVSIANDGPKIPDNVLPRIFNKFFTTKESTSGTGLGLNIVKEIIVEHNAEIVVNSSSTLTEFKVRFPD